MLKIGITGSIGAGKSTVAGIFKVLGVPVFDADATAKNFHGAIIARHKSHKSYVMSSTFDF